VRYALADRRDPATLTLKEMQLHHPQPVSLDTLALHSLLERDAFTALVGSMCQQGLTYLAADRPRPLPGQTQARGFLGLTSEGWTYGRNRGWW
jgi:hypothetical protein